VTVTALVAHIARCHTRVAVQCCAYFVKCIWHHHCYHYFTYDFILILIIVPIVV